MTYNLLLGTAKEILVHFGAQIARVAVAPHQVVDVGLQRQSSSLLIYTMRLYTVVVGH